MPFIVGALVGVGHFGGGGSGGAEEGAEEGDRGHRSENEGVGRWCERAMGEWVEARCSVSEGGEGADDAGECWDTHQGVGQFYTGDIQGLW